MIHPTPTEVNMKKRVDVHNQAELNAATAAGNIAVVRCAEWVVAWESAHVEASGSAHVEAWGSAHIEAWGSAHVMAWGSAHVVAWGSAYVVASGSAHVVAWGSAHVVAWESAHVEASGSAHIVASGSAHVEAWGSAHIEAWGSAHVEAWESAHIEASGSAHVMAWGSAHVEAGSHVSVHVQSPRAVVEGGLQIAAPVFASPSDWLAYCGVKHDGKTALLYKGVSDDYKSPRGGDYTPGTIPEAPDWDGGKAECGGGLHFCARPLDTLKFHADATRFIACPVALSDMSIPPTLEYPSKIKARGCCSPVYEVDRFGARIEVPA